MVNATSYLKIKKKLESFCLYMMDSHEISQSLWSDIEGERG